jgi:chromate transporter
MAESTAPHTASERRGTFGEVLVAFLRLGTSSFGGPIAHLSYFRNAFVARRQWLTEHEFAEFVAVCQLMPGPASSQVAFAIGLSRAGYLGAIAAWIGFTLPSALVMLAVAYGVDWMRGPRIAGVMHGLQLVAVPVVAQAVWLMGRRLCPDWPRRAIAAGGFVVTLALHSTLGALTAIALGAVAGALWCDHRGTFPAAPDVSVSRPVRVGALVAYGVLLLLPPVLWAATRYQPIALFSAFYRSGALVFGGGHVILPLLREAVVIPGWVSDQQFLTGYGAAQAVPGPLASFSAYLGAVMGPAPNGLAGAAIALVAMFLPGSLLVVGLLPFWNEVRDWQWMQGALRGVNATVVGLLAAALVNPIWTAAVLSWKDAVIALAGFGLLIGPKAPPIVIVAVTALTSAILWVPAA